MNVMARESWTDERMDDLKERVDDGFRRMDERFGSMDARFASIDEGFGRIDARIDSLARAIIYGSLTLSGAMIAGFVAILTQI
jgi:hypothetical protein